MVTVVIRLEWSMNRELPILLNFISKLTRASKIGKLKKLTLRTKVMQISLPGTCITLSKRKSILLGL